MKTRFRDRWLTSEYSINHNPFAAYLMLVWYCWLTHQKNMELKWASFITCMYTYIHIASSYDWVISVKILICDFHLLMSTHLYCCSYLQIWHTCNMIPEISLLCRIYVLFSIKQTAAHKNTHLYVVCACFLLQWQNWVVRP